MRLKIAARISDLARLQAYRVGELLQQKGIEIEYAFRASLGDQNQHDPLWKMPEKGVFTEDFLGDLRSGAADLVVHSWKDLPTEPRTQTRVVATLPRADSRDLFLMRRDRLDQARASRRLRVLTSSPRRAYNLKSFFATHLPFPVDDVDFENVRGNIATRVKKLFDLDVDGLIVAKAAIDRLLEAHEAEFESSRAVLREALEKSHFMVLPLSVNPTAAAQGALAIEIRSDRDDIAEALKQIDCAATFRAVEKEREILASYGGGCHQKIGVSVVSRNYGDVLFLRGLTDAGEVLNRADLERAPIEIVPAARVFPRAGEDAAFFTRRPLPRGEWGRAESAKALWIARDSAWPENFRAARDAWIWTAGLTSWRKLAERGVWVNGTSDGFGETESPQLDALAKAMGHELDWLKLTHAASTRGSMPICATYELLAKASGPDLSGRTHFYWMSGSSFDRALELFPAIRDAFHASGPGLTHEHLVRRLGRPTIPIYLDVEAFRTALGVRKL
ncbi:MAG: hydroxymethylbilane synthase [Bdellovibrionota bacterium]